MMVRPRIALSLQYNETKVTNGKAIRLLAENFVQDLDQINGKDMLDRFRQHISLNEKAGKNSVHIAVGLVASDEISNEKMKLVANSYMERIGFGWQPYVVYRHTDTLQPHFHIVSTNIRDDGRRIEMRELIFWKSRELAKEITKEYGLSAFTAAKVTDKELYEVTRAQKVSYGNVFTQRAISDVLNTVVPHYQYTSLDELNAVLRLYNVYANRGKEGSRLYQNRGILYHALDDEGRRVGSPIKASRFFLKPTLDTLEARFEYNRSLREGKRERIETAIDWSLAGEAPDWKGFQEAMEREGIGVVVAENGKDGAGLFFIDHYAQAVFSGTNLGQGYSWREIRERCAKEATLEQEEGLEPEEVQRQHLFLHL